MSSEFADEEEDKQSSDGSLKSVNSKMQTLRSMPSSTSRVSGPAISRPSSQFPSSRSLKGSIPSTDFRKENTKPSTGTSKANAHAQPSSMTRSKSTNAGVNYFKEEKPPRSASMRKSSVTPLTPLKTSKDHSGPRSFLKKGSGAGLSKLRTSISSELNDQQPDSPGPSLNGDVYNQTSCPQETLDYCNSPCGSTSSWFSQDATRVRKKWGSVQVPVLVPDGSQQSKGLKRFLHFGKKSRGSDGKVTDWASVSAVSGADYDMEFDMVSEQIRSSSIGYADFSFSEGMSVTEQGIYSFLYFTPQVDNFKNLHMIYR